jgi:hypothetical protein
MKQTITILSLTLLSFFTKAQTVADFETFTLSANSFYKDTNSVDWQTTNAIFRYDWTKAGSYSYWSGGFAYTNKNDSSNGGYMNLYNCIAFKGYNNSNYYTACQDKGIIVLKAPHNYVNGFWITNSTYAYKSMKSGDTFAKKFGGPSGNDPDWLKVTAKGYLNGTMKPDSSVFYLADFRFSNNVNDYILNTWQYVNCSNLGNVDSLKFFMYSSDTTAGYMNTPAFFCMDNFTTSQGVGIDELTEFSYFNVYPNPAHNIITLKLNSKPAINSELRIHNAIGTEIQNINFSFNENDNSAQIDLSSLTQGLYFIEVNTKTIKFIKE